MLGGRGVTEAKNMRKRLIFFGFSAKFSENLEKNELL
jgi:cell division protein FtsN